MKETGSKNTWNAKLYDESASFVSQLGKGVIELLNPKQGEQILDLGCGTGDLTYEISKAGAIPLGIDSASSMIEAAKNKYPTLDFLVKDALTYKASKPFDAVFSNAVLHWIKNPSKVIETVWHALKSGGRFVCEFGGKGNVEMIIDSISSVLSGYGISASERNPWYYPSIGEYSTLLENQGFRVTYALHFDRPTKLNDGVNGLNNWLDMFTNDFFYDIPGSEKKEIYQRINERLKPALYRNGAWYADYKRIRMRAEKN
ncbi:trans-aconitate methyltransferase [Scopulibacillus daqui]|uniref:Trans-aconitate methyltransferase n=1 Tax=Scopulibacillus daqui TaxID=1469162 RepID=A0ABS2Q3I8_9BACL|nr:class I SAM-dependent methyltransferase [Scopulibacillus daqui]MBM7646087.1 trans-aconitate methyltransferase [Scopulibacillus daqui]